MSVLRRAYLSRGGHISPEAGVYVLRRAHLYRGGPICPEAGASVPRRAYRGTSLVRNTPLLGPYSRTI